MTAPQLSRNCPEGQKTPRRGARVDGQAINPGGRVILSAASRVLRPPSLRCGRFPARPLDDCRRSRRPRSRWSLPTPPPTIKAAVEPSETLERGAGVSPAPTRCRPPGCRPGAAQIPARRKKEGKALGLPPCRAVGVSAPTRFRRGRARRPRTNQVGSFVRR